MKNSTCHGIPRLLDAIYGNPKIKRRITLWLLSVISATGLMIVLVKENLKVYIARDVTYQEELTNHLTLPYPSITFCNSNFYNRSRSMDDEEKAKIIHASYLSRTSLTVDNFNELHNTDKRQIYLFELFMKLMEKDLNDLYELECLSSNKSGILNEFHCDGFETVGKVSVSCAFSLVIVMRVIMDDDPYLTTFGNTILKNKSLWRSYICTQFQNDEIQREYCHESIKSYSYIDYQMKIYVKNFKYFINNKCFDMNDKILDNYFFQHNVVELKNWDYIMELFSFDQETSKQAEPKLAELLKIFYRKKGPDHLFVSSTEMILSEIVFPTNDTSLEAEFGREIRNLVKFNFTNELDRQLKYHAKALALYYFIRFNEPFVVNGLGDPQYSNDINYNITDLFWDAEKNNFLLKCRINSLICEKSYIIYTYTGLGKCLQFNGRGDEELYQSIFEDDELEFVFDLHSYEIDDTVRHFTENTNALIMDIHGKNELKFMTQTVLPIEPGYSTEIVITPTHQDNKQRVRLKYGKDCSKMKKNWPKSFTVDKLFETCKRECMLNNITSKFHCQLALGQISSDLDYCENNRTKILEVKTFRNNFDYNSCNCIESCFTISTSIELSKSDIDPSQILRKYQTYILKCLFDNRNNRTKLKDLNLNKLSKEWEAVANKYCLNRDNIKNNIVMLRIRFTRDTLMEMKSIEVMPIITLVSNIGGVMGLTFGMSIITIVEIMSILLKTIWRKLKENEHISKELQK
ncbi:hypothetical protein SNEBB_005491 [Seison nebaliae]|nr:hypothetical protein SNEBB_005491 [Seison nebaliae]